MVFVFLYISIKGLAYLNTVVLYCGHQKFIALLYCATIMCAKIVQQQSAIHNKTFCQNIYMILFDVKGNLQQALKIERNCMRCVALQIHRKM